MPAAGAGVRAHQLATVSKVVHEQVVSEELGELLAQGKDNLQAPWLGLTAFFVIALMLSLLIFVGEAVRDALDPRKTLM